MTELTKEKIVDLIGQQFDKLLNDLSYAAPEMWDSKFAVRKQAAVSLAKELIK